MTERAALNDDLYQPSVVRLMPVIERASTTGTVVKRDQQLVADVVKTFLHDDRGRPPRTTDDRLVSRSALHRYVDKLWSSEHPVAWRSSAHVAIDRFAAAHPRAIPVITPNGVGMLRFLEVARLKGDLTNDEFNKRSDSTQAILSAIYGADWESATIESTDFDSIMAATTPATSGPTKHRPTHVRRALRMFFSTHLELLPSTGSGLVLAMDVAKDLGILSPRQHALAKYSAKATFKATFGQKWRTASLSGANVLSLLAEAPLLESHDWRDAANIRWGFKLATRTFDRIRPGVLDMTQPTNEAPPKIAATGEGLIRFIQQLEDNGEFTALKAKQAKTAVKNQLEATFGRDWKTIDLSQQSTARWLNAENSSVTTERARDQRSRARGVVRRFRQTHPDLIAPERELHPGPTGQGLIDHVQTEWDAGRLDGRRATFLVRSLTTILPAAYGCDWATIPLDDINAEALRSRDDLGLTNRERSLSVGALDQAIQLFSNPETPAVFDTPTALRRTNSIQFSM